MLAEKYSLVREDSAGNKCELCTDLNPVESLVEIEDDCRRVRVRVVRADLLDVTTIARCAGVGHNNVEECEILLSVALKTNFNSHCESVLNV